MSIKTKTWDPAEHLDTKEAIVAYLDAALEDGDPALIVAALGDVARAQGMAGVARSAHISRESLYKALSSSGNPEFGTVIKVMNALGLRFTVASATNEPTR